MKTIALLALLTASASASAAGAANFAPATGGKPTYEELRATVAGKAATLVRVTYEYHEMDLPPGSTQPIGLIPVRYFVKDFAGNMARCETWIKRIRADESAWTKQKPTYPYFELNVATNAKPLTWKGMAVYKGTDVRCWEAMDFGPPLF
ncbi:MAG TPA: hypothetical protein VL899_05325 [Alphaproteobacteria bacterium]|jgi:hypothetical protein|nr:hypothetical protein [Alphaproteobacteria bacterium]